MAKPKYEKIAEIIAKDIQKNIFKPDSRLPKLADLAAKFNVSYVTMSNAIQSLTARGLVHTIQGSGIYVSAPNANNDFQDILYVAPIEGDLYGKCFRTAQDALYDNNCRLIAALPPDRLSDIAMKNPQKAEAILQEYSQYPLIIDGTRHFPFSILQKVNPSGKGIYFFLHCECDEKDFPQALRLLPDYRQAGFSAAAELHKSGAEHLFVLSYEKLSPKKEKLANNPARTYEDLIKEGMENYAAANNLGTVKIFRTFDDKIINFEELKPFFKKKCGFMAIGDSRAHTLYRYAKQSGIVINRDWFSIGLGKTDWCEIMEPNLKSVSVDEINMMRHLAHNIINKNHSQTIIYPTKL
ncbi:MAG: GntR family transcriptional regulator [Lentisphaeria bacterium]|nr:GntR family transcriptional regulator [Lentisphaeria bacterium]